MNQGNLIGGSWGGADDAGTFEVRDAASDQLIAHVPECGEAETHRAIDAAATARDAWASTPVRDRVRMARKVADELGDREEDLASLIVRLHYVQLGATHRARSVLLRLRPLLRKRAKELRDLMGFNLAGMNMWETHLKEGGGGTKKDDDEDENTANFTDELIKDEDAPGLPGWG